MQCPRCQHDNREGRRFCAEWSIANITPIVSHGPSRLGLIPAWHSTADEIERINVFAQDHGGSDRVRAFFRGQLLELMRWVSEHSAEHPGDGQTFNDPGVRRSLHGLASSPRGAGDECSTPVAPHRIRTQRW